MKLKYTLYLPLTALLILNACSSSRNYQYKNLTEEVEAIKADGGIYKVGTPYTVMGQSYTPKEDYSYSETGTASWYGSDFHNKRTANGETYDMRAITAAHRTLPLPSIVKVTNLENGRSIVARVNDRGPYVKNRIIDLSEKGAELLGYKNKGTTKVKVEILAKESRAIKEAMLSNNSTSELRTAAIDYSNTQPLNQDETVGEYIKNKVSAKPYFVQVGAFENYDRAKQLANNMSRFGNVSIAENYLSKDGVFRVRLGAYDNKDDALKILDRVLDYGHADVTIVEEE